jgi:hypothetical protein
MSTPNTLRRMFGLPPAPIEPPEPTGTLPHTHYAPDPERCWPGCGHPAASAHKVGYTACPKCGSHYGFTYSKPTYHAASIVGQQQIGHSVSEHLDYECQRCFYRIERPVVTEDPR